jgi:hypothetical protein
MKLSAEEAQHTHDYLQEKGATTVELSMSLGISAELIERALYRIANTPDPRPERVAEARNALMARLPSSLEVAERMLWRMLADSLR